MRAGAGLLASTTARAGTYGSAQATQMDSSEGVAQLKAARDLGQRLGQAASAVNAQGLGTHDDGQAVANFVKAIDPAQDGKHPASVNGQPALQPGGDGRNAGDQPVHAYAQPVMLFDTPSATLAASAASTATFAGQAVSIVAQGDLHQTAAHTMTQASGATTSVYAHQGGILAMAANGPVSLRAHTDALSILADQSVTITSVNDEIRIGANEQIQLVAGQSAITLKGGDIDFTTPGAFTVHGATHAFEAGANGTAKLPDLPTGAVSATPDAEITLLPVPPQQFSERILVMNPLTGETSSVPYKLIIDDALDSSGRLDGSGLSTRPMKDTAKPMAAFVGVSGDWSVEYHAGAASPPMAGLAESEVSH